MVKYLYRVAKAFVSLDAFGAHAVERRHGVVQIIVDPHFPLFRVQAVQPADVLRQRSPPRHRHCQEKCVETGVVEAFSDITPGCDQHSFPAFGCVFEALHDLAALFGSYASMEQQYVARDPLKSFGEPAGMVLSLGEENRWAPFL